MLFDLVQKFHRSAEFLGNITKNNFSTKCKPMSKNQTVAKRTSKTPKINKN